MSLDCIKLHVKRPRVLHFSCLLLSLAHTSAPFSDFPSRIHPYPRFVHPSPPTTPHPQMARHALRHGAPGISGSPTPGSGPPLAVLGSAPPRHRERTTESDDGDSAKDSSSLDSRCVAPSSPGPSMTLSTGYLLIHIPALLASHPIAQLFS